MKNTKEHIIDILIENKGRYISGEDISEKLGISRASIWKGIQALKKEGYDIDSKSGAGYTLIGKIEEQAMSPYEIKHKLNTKYIAQNIHYFESIDSTNIQASKISDKSSEGTVIIADAQTDGKGRTGKKWLSKQNAGIYFSIILKPDIPLFKASFLTQVTGAVIAETLGSLNIPCEIKWPNDIVINHKKIAGILTEMNAEIDRINYIIVGIGININANKFDDELSKTASSIENEGYIIDKIEFLRKFFELFETCYENFKNDDNKQVLKTLREKSAVLGKEIYVIKKGEKEICFAENIDDNGNLVVRNQFGLNETIFTGEISIRGLESYI